MTTRSSLVIALLAVSACSYGKATPESCHAKHIRDGKGKPGDYDHCMAGYYRGQEAQRIKDLKLEVKRRRLEAELSAYDGHGDGGN